MIVFRLQEKLLQEKDEQGVKQMVTLESFVFFFFQVILLANFKKTENIQM